MIDFRVLCFVSGNYALGAWDSQCRLTIRLSKFATKFPPEKMAGNQAPPASTGFLSLPRNARDRIYEKSLIVPPPIVLFEGPPSQGVESFAPQKPAQWPALLLVNRQLHDEARSVLYGHNHFNLVDTSQGEIAVIQSFLARIGPSSAGSLTHLSISFPAVEYTSSQEPGSSAVKEEGFESLKILQEKCTNIQTLELYVYGENSRTLDQARDDSSPSAQEIVSEVDRHLKAISSLKKVIVRFYDGEPPRRVRDMMQELGWAVLQGDDDE